MLFIRFGSSPYLDISFIFDDALSDASVLLTIYIYTQNMKIKSTEMLFDSIQSYKGKCACIFDFQPIF